MTAYKLLTGRDGPMLNVEMTLMNTFAIAKSRFEKQQGKSGKR